MAQIIVLGLIWSYLKLVGNLRISGDAILALFRRAYHNSDVATAQTNSGALLKSVLKPAGILFVLLALVGCASTGMVKNASPITASKPFALDYLFVETTSSLAGLGPEQSNLCDHIISGLRERELFNGVSADKADVSLGSGVKIEANIKEIRKVSKNRRLWLGALAGRAQISVQVTISDLNNGRLMETFEVEGNSSGGSSLAGTTDEAIQVAAGQIVGEVVKINEQTAE